MKPLSRGCPPEEFTLRVPCSLSQQFTFSDVTVPQTFKVEGVCCAIELVSNTLVISASGFSTAASASAFFKLLQHKFTKIAVEERIAAFFPTQYVEPTEAPFSFMPDDMCCASHGWPVRSITPLLVPQHAASIYPEHKYVAIDETVAFSPIFTYSVARLAEKLGVQDCPQSITDPVDEAVLLAAWAYAHAARTTQWVWSFLLTVMALEMLADERPTSNDTRSAIKSLIHQAQEQYGDCQSLDLQRITNCLRQASTISKTRALRDLVKKYCAPGVAKSPLTDIFVDEADCDRKVGEIYKVRSKYVHEGRLKPSVRLKYPFEALHNTALRSLGHILQSLLNN